MADLLPTVFIVYNIASVAIDAESERRSYNLNDEDQIDITMNGFPDSCCHSFVAVVAYTGLTGQYLHLEFKDFDIPDDSRVLFLDGDDKPLRDQVMRPNGLFVRRIFTFDSPVLQIVFKPPPNDDEQPKSTFYAGFKIVVWTSKANGSSSRFWPQSVDCPIPQNTADGGVLHIREDEAINGHDILDLPIIPMYDCIWVLKKTENLFAHVENTMVYVNILEMNIPESLIKITRLEVRSGKSSEGKLLKSASGDHGISSFEADESVYMRFQMPYVSKRVDEKYNIRIGYGIFNRPSSYDSSLECDFGGSRGGLCLAEEWCVPWAYICDGVSNCPSHSDEIDFDCLAVKIERRKEEKQMEYELLLRSGASSPMPSSVPKAQASLLANSRNGRSTVCNDFEKKCYSSSDNMYQCYQAVVKCPGSTCDQFQAFCANGDCVFDDTYCDDDFGSSCGSMEKQCPNGECVSFTADCRCEFENQKYCSSTGECLSKGGYCESDPCPSHTPFQCENGQKCIPEHFVCDGYGDCDDSSDEAECSLSKEPKKDYTFQYVLYGFIIPFVVLSGCLGFWWSTCKKMCRQRPSRTSRTEVPLDNVSAVQRPPSGASYSPVRTNPPPSAPWPTSNASDVTREDATRGINPSRDTVESSTLNDSMPPTYYSATATHNITQDSEANSEDLEPPPSYEAATRGNMILQTEIL